MTEIQENEYRVVAKLYHLKIDSVLKAGISVFNDIRISNSQSKLEELFNDKLFLSCIGKLQRDSLDDGTYLYGKGKLIGGRYVAINQLNKKDDSKEFLDYYLSSGYVFSTFLWLVKDHSIETKLGFLQWQKGYYHQVFSTSKPFTRFDSSGRRKEVIFSKEEIQQALNYYRLFEGNEKFRVAVSTSSKERYSDSNQPGLNRIERFFYLIQAARSLHVLPMKIAFYCTALESILSQDTMEITHKISERTALMLGDSLEERKKLFKLVKDAYTIRSQTIHGGEVNKKKQESLPQISKDMDDLLRRLMLLILLNKELFDLFSGNEENLRKYFVNLVLS